MRRLSAWGGAILVLAAGLLPGAAPGQAVPPAASAKGAPPAPPGLTAPRVKAAAIPVFREELRKIVDELAQYAETRDRRFLIIGRMPQGLMATSRWERWHAILADPAVQDRAAVPDDAPGGPLRRIVHDLAGVAIDDANCAKPAVPRVEPPSALPPPSPILMTPELVEKLRGLGLTMMGLDSCGKESPAAVAARGRKAKILSIRVAEGRIPADRPPQENARAVTGLAQAENGLAALAPGAYPTKEAWLAALRKSNADLLAVDAFFRADIPLTKADVAALRYKFNGPRRLLLTEIDLTRARDDRFYWKRDWQAGHPAFLRKAEGGKHPAIAVDFWDPAWKAIIGEYFKGVMDLGFDGVILSGLDAPDALEQETLLE